MINEYCLSRVNDYVLRVEEFVCPNTILGRKGQIPDAVIFGNVTDEDYHEKFTDSSHGKAPHYVILRDGSVRNYIYVTDSSPYFTTSIFSDSENYYAKARGLVSCRPVNVALYSVCVLFEGDELTDEQMLAAAALLRLISLKFIRIYRKKLPLDVNHIISATALPCGYSFNGQTEEIIDLCKRKPL